MNPPAAADLIVANVIGAKMEALNTETFCWRETEGRGLAKVPVTCNARDGYDYKLREFRCWQKCPDTATNLGVMCSFNSYGRGPGVRRRKCERRAWALRNDPGFEHFLANGEGNNCEKGGMGLLWRPKCRPGYVGAAFLCNPVTDCAGMGPKSGLAACMKRTYVAACAPGQEKGPAGLLCRNICPRGSQGVGPVCWSQCPAEMPVNCGIGCGRTKADCASALTNQITSPLMVAANGALLAVTAGGSSAATVPAKTAAKLAANAAAKAAVRSAAKAALKASVRAKLKGFAKAAAKEIAIDASFGAVLSTTLWGTLNAVGKRKFEEAVEVQVHEALAAEDIDEDAVESIVEAAMIGVEKENPNDEFPWEALDPTGIAEVVVAYNKPSCRQFH